MAQISAEGSGAAYLFSEATVAGYVTLTTTPYRLPLREWIYLYDGDGNRKPLPDKFIAGWNFNLEEFGGYGTFTLSLLTALDDRSDAENPVTEHLPYPPQPNDRVDIYLGRTFADKKPAYRGWIERTPPAIAEGTPTAQYSGVGRVGRQKTLKADVIFSRADGGADASEVLAWLASKKLAGEERLGDFVKSFDRLSPEQKFETLDFHGQDCKSAFDQVADAASAALFWGWDFVEDASDVTAPLPDRLYSKNRPLTVNEEAYRLRVGRPGDAVQYFEDDVDISEVHNAVRLIGGKSKAPNLLYNPSFERPLVAGTDSNGNLIPDPSFEAGTGLTLSGGASRKKTGSKQGEQANTGDWFIEVDNAGEYLERVVLLPATLTADLHHIFQVYLACETSTGARSVAVTVECQDIAGVPIGADPEIDAVEVAVAARSYVLWKEQFVAPVGTNKVRLRIAWEAGPGSLQERATMIDDWALYSNAASVTDGWEVVTRGNAQAIIEYAYDGAPAFHGDYSVKIITLGMDGGSTNVVYVRPSDAHWISVKQATEYHFYFRGRAHADLDVLSFRLGYEGRDSGGARAVIWGGVDAITDTDWQEKFDNFDLGSLEAVRPVLELRSNGTHFLDAFDFYEAGLDDGRDFNDGDSLNLVARADDAATFPGLTAEALASIADYGLREAPDLDVPQITSIDRAKSYLTGWFNRHAVKKRQGRLTLDPCDVHLKYVENDGEAGAVMGLLSVAGVRVSVPDQFPAKISYSKNDDGSVRCDVDLTNLRPDPALFLAEAFGFGDGIVSAGGGANLTATPGNSVVVGSGAVNGKSEHTVTLASDSRLSGGDRVFTYDLESEADETTLLVGVRGFGVPPSKVALTGDAEGRLRRVVVTLAAPDQFFTGDTVLFWYMPKGAQSFARLPYVFTVVTPDAQAIPLPWTPVAGSLQVWSRNFILGDDVWSLAGSTLSIPAGEGLVAGDKVTVVAAPSTAPIGRPFRQEYVIPSNGYVDFYVSDAPVQVGGAPAATVEVGGMLDDAAVWSLDTTGAKRKVTISDTSDRTGDTVVIRGYF